MLYKYIQYLSMRKSANKIDVLCPKNVNGKKIKLKNFWATYNFYILVCLV